MRGASRLTLVRLTTSTLDALLPIAAEPGVRRYLLDGRRVDRRWCVAERAHSDALRSSHGVELWLLEDEGQVVGFAGFKLFADHDPEPHLLYALREASTGRGLATEAARECIRRAAAAGFRRVVTGVDAHNARSLRLLERLGFRRVASGPGALGTTHRCVLDLALG